MIHDSLYLYNNSVFQTFHTLSEFAQFLEVLNDCQTNDAAGHGSVVLMYF